MDDSNLMQCPESHVWHDPSAFYWLSSNNMDWITKMGFCLYVTVCWLLFMALITTSWNIDLQELLHWGGNVGREPMMNDYDPFICIKNHSSVESLKKGDIGGSV